MAKIDIIGDMYGGNDGELYIECGGKTIDIYNEIINKIDEEFKYIGHRTSVRLTIEPIDF